MAGDDEALAAIENDEYVRMLHARFKNCPVQRQVLVWTYDGATPAEIAAGLGMSPANVRSALRTAREKIRLTPGENR